MRSHFFSPRFFINRLTVINRNRGEKLFSIKESQPDIFFSDELFKEAELSSKSFATEERCVINGRENSRE